MAETTTVVPSDPIEVAGQDRYTREGIRVRGEGLIAQTWDRHTGANATILVDGTAYFTLIGLLAGDVVTNLSISVPIAGVTMSLSKVGLYTTAGVRLALSADQGTAWESAGVKTIAMTSPYTITTSGAYYVAIVAKGGTLPTVMRGGIFAASTSQGAGIGSGSMVAGVQTGQTDLPTSATIVSGSGFAHWVGVS